LNAFLRNLNDRGIKKAKNKISLITTNGASRKGFAEMALPINQIINDKGGDAIGGS